MKKVHKSKKVRAASTNRAAKRAARIRKTKGEKSNRRELFLDEKKKALYEQKKEQEKIDKIIASRKEAGPVY